MKTQNKNRSENIKHKNEEVSKEYSIQPTDYQSRRAEDTAKKTPAKTTNPHRPTKKQGYRFLFRQALFRQSLFRQFLFLLKLLVFGGSTKRPSNHGKITRYASVRYRTAYAMYSRRILAAKIDFFASLDSVRIRLSENEGVQIFPHNTHTNQQAELFHTDRETRI